MRRERKDPPIIQSCYDLVLRANTLAKLTPCQDFSWLISRLRDGYVKSEQDITQNDHLIEPYK